MSGPEVAERPSDEELSGRLAAIVTASVDAIISVDLSGTITSWNGGAERLLGYTLDEAIGRSVEMLNVPGSAPDPTAQISAVLHGEAIHDFDTVRLRKDGTAVPLSVSISPIRNAEGKIIGVAGIGRDITARTRMERELRASEIRFRGAFDGATVGMALIDVTGRFLRVNRALREIVGRGEAELLTLAYNDITHPDDLPSTQQFTRELLGGNIATAVFEKRYIHRDGQTLWVQISTTLLRDEDGRPLYFITQFQDVTKRRLAEDALKESEARFEAFAAHNPALSFIKDEDGRYVYANARVTAPFGRMPATFVGLTDSDFMLPQDAEAARQEDRTVWDTGTPLEVLTPVPVEQGPDIFVLKLKFLFEGAGGRRYLGGFALDITALKQTELALEQANVELARSNAELNAFATVAAHDLRAPLASIGGFAELLGAQYGDRLGDRGTRYIARITTAVERQQQLIDDLLAYARAGGRPHAFAPVDCMALADGVTALLASDIAAAEATVRCEGLPTVWGDSAQLAQVFQNLIGNAVKFRRARVPPVVTVTAELRDQEWLVRVRDNGIGIAPENTERVFAIFQRLHSSSEYPGTGIGLALCRKIVERHGGLIWIESELSRGATFLFTLPRVPSSAQPAS